MGTNISKKELLARRKKAYKMWVLKQVSEVDGMHSTKSLETIARDAGLTMEQLEYYRVKDKWEKRFDKAMKSGKLDKYFKDKAQEVFDKQQIKQEADFDVTIIEDIFEEFRINRRQQVFILSYLQTFNAKQSAIKAGYAERTAKFKGHQLLGMDHIAGAMDAIKKLMYKKLYISAYDIIQYYVEIAYSDITEYVEFNQDKVNLKDSNKVDGKLIQEVKQGRDGVTIKLVDKMKALEKLEKLFEIMPDRRLELEREKLDLQKSLVNKSDGDGDNKVVIVNDIS